MRFFATATLLSSALLLASVGAGAQNAIHAATMLPHPAGSLPLQCRNQAAVLTDILDRYPHPDRWQWVVLCDDSEWRKFLSLRGIQSDSQGTSTRLGGASEEIYASTEIDQHITCVRGTTLLKPDSPLAQPEHVIAHELAHIMLHTENEERAERQAMRWLQEREEHSNPAVGGQ